MPRRRCAGCGRTAPKSELIRFAVARAGARRRRAVIDANGTMPGRGAYVCRGERPGLPDAGCLERALRRDGIARTLRSSATVDLSCELVESTDR